MHEENKIRCIVSTKNGEVVGTILKQYEEIGGPDDGAIFAIIALDDGQVINVKMSKMIK